MGRPRDGDDRVAWLLDHKRFDKALAVLDTDRGLKASTHEQVCHKCVCCNLAMQSSSATLLEHNFCNAA